MGSKKGWQWGLNHPVEGVEKVEHPESSLKKPQKRSVVEVPFH